MDRLGPAEPFEEYCRRSRKYAMYYILKYSNGDNFLFAPVMTTEITAGL
ncbi:MAG: hypothetical protein K9K67_05990 [Bacteriovoracaceae bacterium]|nr:hypothetical protein [Bacteriovoracaceae bacterium]